MADIILAWEREFGQIPSGNVVLLYTGWQDKSHIPHFTM
ncbi:MAG TPA: cyclase family protein [Nostocaceae cyanobacterium]|nr:cyclase family protein [Nostocaceae cyanobacterium]